MTPLPLSGQATAVAGFDGAPSRPVLRLRAPLAEAAGIAVADGALVTDAADAARARMGGFNTAVVVGDAEVDRANLDGFERVVHLGTRFGYLADGDILGLDPHSRRFRVLYRRASRHNAFLVTERCNHYCLMCSQPPRDVDDGWILDEIEASLPLVDPLTPSIGFTGGEPLLDWQRFIPLLGKVRDTLPQTEIHVLTNGRAFARREVAEAWAALRHSRLCAGIPIYAAVDHVHDHVVQARGAFDETVLGIMRLKDKGQRVEVRVVLHRLTAVRLVETCSWLARNLPFVDHVALMGLENTGFTLANQDLLWIDPVDYCDDLAEGVDILAAAGVNVSIYNLPRCVLDRRVWPVAVQSISDWKNAFVPECDGCIERPNCGGFFSTGRPLVSRGVKALLGPAEDSGAALCFRSAGAQSNLA